MPRRRAYSGTLTERERTVVELIAGGLEDKEITAALGIAYSTVRTHVESILAKLELRDRKAVILWACQQRSDPPPPSGG